MGSHWAWRATIFIMSTRFRGYHVAWALCTAFAAHIAILMLLAGVTPMELLDVVLLQASYYSRRASWLDPGSLVAMVILLLRWSDPEMFVGSLSRWWPLACLLLLYYPIAVFLRLVVDTYRFLVIGANVDIQHSTSFAFHLGLSLCLSILIVGFLRGLSRSSESVESSPDPERRGTKPGVSIGDEPVCPAPGHFPLTPAFQSGFGVKPTMTDTDLYANTDLLHTAETFGEQFKRRKVIYPIVKPTFKDNSWIPRPLDTTLQPQSLGATGESSILAGFKESPSVAPHNTSKSWHNALSPQSLCSPAPLWTRILREVRSPGLPRSLSAKSLPQISDHGAGSKSVDDDNADSLPNGTISTPIHPPSIDSNNKRNRDAAPNTLTSPTTLSYVRSARYPFHREEAPGDSGTGQGVSHQAAKRNLDEVNDKLAKYGIKVCKLEGEPKDDPSVLSVQSRSQRYHIASQLSEEVLPYLESMDLSNNKDWEFFRKHLIVQTRELLDRLKKLGPISRPISTNTRRTRAESDPKSIDQGDNRKPPAKKRKPESINQVDGAETPARKLNPLYGGPNEIHTSAYKVPNNLKEVLFQCKHLEKHPKKERDFHTTIMVKRICEILRETADFIDFLTTIDDEALERLPDDLFERSGPLLRDTFRCGKNSLKRSDPSVVDYGLPYARQMQVTLESLGKRRDMYRKWEQRRKVKFSLPASASS